MRVLFCHGKEGTANGTKATRIKQNFDATVPKLTNSFAKEDFEKDLALVEGLARDADVIVGSSRGGAIVAALKTNKRKVLIAPAIRKFGVLPQLRMQDTILHCAKDDLVDFEDSHALADVFGVKLIECGLDHRMSDEETINKIIAVIKGE